MWYQARIAYENTNDISLEFSDANFDIVINSEFDNVRVIVF